MKVLSRNVTQFVLVLVSYLVILSACNPYKIETATPHPTTTSTKIVLPTAYPSSTKIPTKTTIPKASPSSTHTPTKTSPCPTFTPRQKKTATFTPSPTVITVQGRITFPYRLGDAGHYALLAGATITLTWEEAPLNARSYEFSFIFEDKEQTIILGVDKDPSDGVTIDWKVLEHITGEFQGNAKFADGHVVSAGWSGYIHASDAPPVGICTLSSGTNGVLELFRQPNRNDSSFAILFPGPYAQVFERTADGWYYIDASSAFDTESRQAVTGFAWVDDLRGLHFFGPCDDIPIVGN